MILEAVDSLYAVGQVVGKSFGFIDAHDPTIEDASSADGHRARFVGADPGWPELVLDLPADARFHQAMSGPLTRSGEWLSGETPADLQRFFEARVAVLGGSWKATERGVRFAVTSADGLETSLVLAETARLGTMIAITQKRTDRGLKASMKSRLETLERRRRP